MKSKQKAKKVNVLAKNRKGITLIALVVTIVVLLILAGVTINAILGDDGIIAQAKKASDAAKQGATNDEESLKDISDQLNNIINGNGAGEESAKPTEPPTLIDNITLADAFVKKDNTLEINKTITPENATNKELDWKSSDDSIVSVENGVVTGKGIGRATITATAKDESGKIATCIVKVSANGNENLQDLNGNPYTVPDNFTIVPDGVDDVEYKYTGDETPAVQDGIVVEDEEGNQFVWIPVSVNGRKIKDIDNKETEITLGRYEADQYTGNASDAKNGNDIVASYFQELASSDKGNKPAKNIGDFIESVNTNGGYYLARYEAGVTNYEKDNITTENSGEETNWTGYKSEGDKKLKLVSKKDQQVWNWITQNKASEVAQVMYTNKPYESDLVNSYAWDTAIVYIQKYSGDNDYSNENGQTFSKQLRNTGAGTGTDGDKIDKVCNIYDMASNCIEWTTETMNSTQRTLRMSWWLLYLGW